MKTSLEERKNQYRGIYEKLYKFYRIKIVSLSKKLKRNRSVIGRRINEAFEEKYISLPQIRLRSYANMKEYVYFVNCENPLKVFRQYKEDMNVVYHAVMSGFANVWLITKSKINVEGDIIAVGLRSDYHVAYAPNHSWERAIQIIWEKVKAFNPELYNPQGIIKTHWDEIIPWDTEFEKLFREFKYNGRKPLTPIMRKYCISSQKTYEFLEKLPECCTVFTRYFPDKKSAYDPYLFMFETDYEDFIIDLFSELPTSSFFFKVADKLFLLANIKRSFLRDFNVDMSDISELHIPLLVEYFLEKGIIKNEKHAIIEYSWGKDL
jgi:DNA-binding Lrp family transcriptional regulator